MKENVKKMIYMFRLLFISGIPWENPEFRMDMKRWKDILNLKMPDRQALAYLLWKKKEFRNLFFYRNRRRWFYRNRFKLIYPLMETLFIETEEIGGGLFIQHGFATMISAKSIGENCWINQQVTVGYKGKGDPPAIGNNVMITCGAKVLGNIIIGDNAIIGANAVVVKNVKQGAVMAGIPARQIKKSIT